LQRFGPDETHPAIRKSLAEIDTVAGDLADAARASGRSVVVLSEYGITKSTPSDPHQSRASRRQTCGGAGGGRWRIADPTVSKRFAVADHQIAHVYVSRSGGCGRKVREVLEACPDRTHL